jgi:hypothetical protein
MPPFPLPDPPLHDDLVRLRPPEAADVPAIMQTRLTLACYSLLAEDLG